MNKFARSLALAKASWQVLLSEEEMIGYTALGALFTLIATALFAVPGLLMLMSQGGTAGVSTSSIPPGGFVLLFLFYFVVSFIALFFNTALVGAALVKLRGGDPNFAEGMKMATKNAGHLFVYALISATVGVILAVIEEKFKIVGQIAGSILGGAWAIVTFLVVPVMVAEGINPFEAIKRSAQLLRKTWGEQIIGSGGIGLMIFLLALLGVIPIALGALSGFTAGLIAGAVISVAYWGLLFLAGSALTGIYRAALYLYAETGQVPAQFDGWMLTDAFKRKSSGAEAGNI